MTDHSSVVGSKPPANYPANCWYVAATTDEVGRTLTARTLLGRPVVLYRRQSGAVVALADRCPHRSLPLSLGTLAQDQVVCGYHGMTFDSDGQCTRVPTQERVPLQARVESYPVRESAPFIWIWLGDPSKAALVDPPVLPWLEADSWTSVGETMMVDANYMLLHDNALDLTHFPYVHPESSPAGYLSEPPPLSVEVSETSVAYYRDFPPAPLVAWQAQTTGLPQDRDYAQRESGVFVSPGLHVDRMHIFLPDEQNGSYEKVLTRAFTPLTHDRTMVTWQVSRQYQTDRPDISVELMAVHRRTLQADKVLVEAIQSRTGLGHFGPEINVTADVAAIQAKRITERLVARERERFGTPRRISAR